MNPNDPIQNADGVARYLRQQLDRFGNYPLAPSRIQCGAREAVAKYKGIPPYKETRSYVMKILGSGNNNVLEQSRTRALSKISILFGSSVVEAAEIPKPQINADKLFGSDVSGEPTKGNQAAFRLGKRRNKNLPDLSRKPEQSHNLHRTLAGIWSKSLSQKNKDLIGGW